MDRRADEMARRRVWLGGVARVWLLTAGMLAVALALMATVGREVGALGAPVRLSWWSLALLFYIAEAHPVRFHFRRDAQSFSLNEIPIVLGLFFATPADLVVGLITGSSIALALHRRQSRLKLAFNLSHFFLGVVLAIVVFDAVTFTDPLGPQGWVGAIVATVVATLVGHAAITTAMVVSGGEPEVEKLPQVLLLGMAATTTNAALGLTAVTVMWREPRAAWLLIVPAATLYFAYRAYAIERNRHETIEFLYESTRTLHRSPELDSALLGVLDQARRMFRAERVEITLFPSRADDPALRTSLGPGDGVETMVRADVGADERAWVDSLDCERPALYPGSSGDEVVASLLARGVREAMVQSVRADGRLVASFLVANRLGDTVTFDDADLVLFESLARNVGQVLQDGRLEQSLAQLRELEDQLRHQSRHDPLTGLANRTLLLERTEAALGAHPAQGDAAILFVDLDDFKAVNDTRGPSVGDRLLSEFASRLAGAIRSDAVAARVGGDEFAVLIERVAGEAEAEIAAQQVLAALSVPVIVDGEELSIHGTVGVAVSGDCRSADELLRNADVAMHTAKARGKNCYALFEPGMHVAVVERHELVADLQRAVVNEEFVVHYQPIVELATGRIAALEALVRWQHPVRGLVPPGVFIGLAEETGLIVQMGHAVLQQACRQVDAWRSIPGHESLRVTVNLSPRQLQQPGFVGELMTVIAETGVDPDALVLEITESLLMQDGDGALETLDQLKQLGMQLAMDDFGTGWSSLSYLARLPLDTLKVAKPFVDGLGRSDKETAFARAIVRLGQTVQLRLIAEGIETAEQLEELREVACDMGQGFYFARPGPADQIEELLRSGLPLLSSRVLHS